MQKEKKSMEAWKIVQQFAPYTRIVHHIAGRIRLKLLDGAPAAEKIAALSPERVRAALETIPGVRQVSFNLLARSCTLEYDPQVIPHDTFPDLIAGRETPGAQALLAALRARQAGIPRQ